MHVSYVHLRGELVDRQFSIILAIRSWRMHGYIPNSLLARVSTFNLLHYIVFRSVVCENRVPRPELGPNERGVDTADQARYVLHGADTNNRSPEHLYAAIEKRSDQKRVQLLNNQFLASTHGFCANIFNSFTSGKVVVSCRIFFSEMSCKFSCGHSQEFSGDAMFFNNKTHVLHHEKKKFYF